MSRRYIVVVVLLTALLSLVAYLILIDSQLRGGALEKALAPIIEKKDGESSVVALAIRENHRETRQIAALWSALYWGFAWTSAVFGGLAGLILKLEWVLQNEKLKRDIAAFLAFAAALLVTISTGGDFQRKWQANRTASAEIERTGYAFLQQNGGNARAYLAEVGDSLHKRHLTILGGSDHRRLGAEPIKATPAEK